MKHVDRYTDSYEGFSYEIQHWTEKHLVERELAENWTYYIFLKAELLPADLWKQLIEAPRDDRLYHYSKTWLANLDWHCGISFGTQLFTETGKVRAIKAGCDYQHYWDEGHYYNLGAVQHDAIRTIKSIQTLIDQKGEKR
jgi:hypothetical protein